MKRRRHAILRTDADAIALAESLPGYGAPCGSAARDMLDAELAT